MKTEDKFTQIIKLGFATVAGASVVFTSLASERPHDEKLPGPTTIDLSVPYRASAGIIEDVWESTIEGAPVRYVRRRIPKDYVDYILVTAQFPESNTLSLAISRTHTARDSIEAIFAQELARRHAQEGEATKSNAERKK